MKGNRAQPDRLDFSEGWRDMKNKKNSGILAALFFLLATVFASPLAAANLSVINATELQKAIQSANASGGDTTILLRDGVYTIGSFFNITAPGITVSSQSGNRDSVVIQGDAMSADAAVKMIFRVASSHFTVRNITMRKVGWHLIQVVGESDADYAIISNCVLQDAYEQLLKVSNNSANPNTTGDNGRVENCLFEYSAGIGPQYYIGGIDAHGSRNWIVRGNTFRNIISPGNTVAEHAIHFWDAPSADNLVERNLIINCDRGIGLGLGNRGSSGGVIRNNMIYHTAGQGTYADVGIGLETCPNAQVYNNTIYMENSYPNAIEYRFPITRNVLIKNNLVNKSIQSRNGASAKLETNVENAAGSWFVQLSSGNLHLAAAIAEVVDTGQAVPGLSDDFDGKGRPIGSGIDIGADEYDRQ
jgi:hypothetical protein